MPVPAYDLIDIHKYLVHNSQLYISSGRGCKHSCAFCSARLQYGRNVYFRSHESTIREIKELKRAYEVDRFYFYNENLSIWPYLEDFCTNIQPVNILWSAQANINDLEKDMIPLLASSGCYELGFGIESGSSEMQSYIGKIIKSDSLEKFAKLKCAGINARGFFVVGFPNETKYSIIETARYLIASRLAGLVDVAIFPVIPDMNITCCNYINYKTSLRKHF